MATAGDDEGDGVLSEVSTFNGTTWNQPVDSGRDTLTSLSCPTVVFCVAVGYDANANYRIHVFAPGGEPHYLGMPISDVSCGSPTFCVAIGYLTGQVSVFDGTTWSTPRTIPHATDLTSVSCVASGFCLVGDKSMNLFIRG